MIANQLTNTAEAGFGNAPIVAAWLCAPLTASGLIIRSAAHGCTSFG
jgi:hypothetical protein